MRYPVLLFLALAVAACVSDTLRPTVSEEQQREQDEHFQQQHRAILPDSF